MLNDIMRGVAAGVDLFNASENREQQREFAQHGIRWRVADAQAAGIHPLYAMGAPTISPAGAQVGGAVNAIAGMGQDISRAMNATRTSDERVSAFNQSVQELTVQKMGLENELLASQIARFRDNPNPPFPASTSRAPGGGRKSQGGSSSDPYAIGEEEKFEDRPKLALGRGAIATDPSVANAEDFEKRYGDEASIVFAPAIMWRDAIQNFGQPETWPRQVVDDVYRRLVQELKSESDNARRFARRAIGFLRNERR